MECKNIEQVRENIDRIDKDIVKLIAERSTFVKEASKFKKDSDAVKAPQRVEAVIVKVRTLAEEYDVSPEIIEKLYRNMISDFINLEMDSFEKNRE